MKRSRSPIILQDGDLCVIDANAKRHRFLSRNPKCLKKTVYTDTLYFTDEINTNDNKNLSDLSSNSEYSESEDENLFKTKDMDTELYKNKQSEGTYTRTYQRDDSGYLSDEEEDDTILADNVVVRNFTSSTDAINFVNVNGSFNVNNLDQTGQQLYQQYSSYVENSSKHKQKPDEVSQILIPHKLQTDTECGDYFGASLATYRIEGSRFFRHRLVEIKDGYPAQKMKIQDGDDLVYVNSTFVPELNHTAVLNLFHHDVPVDGKTRLTLILLHKKDNKKRQWYQTSAILMPDPRHHKGEIHPEIRNEEYKELESGFERHHKFRYTISGTALYMSIGHTGVCGINITQGGSPDPTLVWRHEKTEDAPPPYYISRKWALGAIDGQSFICLQNDRVTVVDKIDHATWFDNTINIGTDVWFGVHDIYLACGTSGKFFITKNRDDLGAKFGSHPVDGYDCVDCSNDCSRAEGNDATSESSDMEVTEVTPKGCNDSGYASPYGSQEQPTENNQCLLQSFASQNSIEIDG
ncbi:uncharacterized protein LOC128219886 isoform X2 [Mya arenaria]|uniref:uncharacterized protein LOC128219886 isoform X2 n=1 Tax=Mya arenaria TaxID=6604 RepID=UPI0022E436D4|nr:uncharacterized protein LOC128219886 isoform X2 [Mya arenaria]